MEDYISISSLNDYIFCPYSIYLHNVYKDTDEGIYHASPQTKGKAAHLSVDNKTSSTKVSEVPSLSVYSDSLGIIGKIDVYREDKKILIERKYKLQKLFKGQIYQLWAQYFCLLEMGYQVKEIAFYEISTNKMIPLELPGDSEYSELKNFIEEYKRYNPLNEITVSKNKCVHCIYCNLCDKTKEDNVYT